MEDPKIYCRCYSAMKKFDRAIVEELENSSDTKQNTFNSSFFNCPESNEFCKESAEPHNITTSTSSVPKSLRTSICVRKRRHSGSSNKSPKIDDLEKDLSTIKNQLLYLTRNKVEALRIAEELQRRYKKLMKKKYKQQEKIYRLETENMALNMIIRKMTSRCACGCGDSEDVVGVKQKLDMYEIKMNELYQECINSLTMLQISRDQISFAIKQKSQEYRELSESNRELYEMAKNEEKKCCRLEVKCCRLQTEKDSYQCHCYNLSKNIEELQTTFNQTAAELAQNQETSVEMLEKKDKTIQELNSIIEKLENQISETKASEDTEDVTSQYSQVLSQNKELTHKLDQVSVRSKNGCTAALNKIHSLKEQQSNLLEEQKKLIFQMDKLNGTLKEKESFILQLKRSNDEKDMMIQRQKDEMVDILQKPLNNGSISTSMPRACTEVNSSDSCLSLSKELESLISSLYAEIDKTLVKDKIIQEQFEQNCFLKCSLSSKEAELAYVKDALQCAKDEIQKINSEKVELLTSRACDYDLDEEQCEEGDCWNEEASSDEIFYYSVRTVPN